MNGWRRHCNRGRKATRTKAEKAARARIEQRLSAAFLPSPLVGEGPGVRGFHWELEFPEVFGRDNPGFDVIVGNPPFVGGTENHRRIGDGSYRDYLVERIANGKRAAPIYAPISSCGPGNCCATAA